MKRKIIAMLVVSSFFATSMIDIKPINVKADVSYDAIEKFTVENVAFGKNSKFTYADGTQIPSSQLFDLHTNQNCDTSGLTDGDFMPGNGHKIINVKDGQGEAANCFAVIDLEKTYTITEVGLKFWNDHHFNQIVIQVAKNEDFSDAITVFNNDIANVMNQGSGTAIEYYEVADAINKINVSVSKGRYIRVSGKSQNNHLSMFSEIQVMGVTGGIAPVSTNLGFEKQYPEATLELSAQDENSTIYYTLDGSYPNKDSIKYEKPIKIGDIASPKALVRAISINEEGKESIVSEFKYDISEESGNVAQGKMPTIPTEYLENGKIPIFQGNPSQTSITDGLEDPVNTLCSTTPCWLLIDFGRTYNIEKVKAKFWHDWAFGAIIQLSTSADFSDGNYTVFSNYGKGEGIWDKVEKVPMTKDEWYVGYKEFTFTPVPARYMRVYNVSVTNAMRYSIWEELQAWSVASSGGGSYPVATRPIIYAKDVDNFVVGNQTTKDEVLAMLPTEIEVKDVINNVEIITGTWKCDTYDMNTEGDYEFIFESDSVSFVDSYQILKSKITVSPKADKTLLNEKLEYANTLQEDNYTIDSWKRFSSKIGAIKEINDKVNALQSEVDTALSNLEKALSDLSLRGDKTELSRLINESNQLNQNDYMPESWDSFMIVLDNAKAVNDDENTDETTVNYATKNLIDAKNNLQLIGNKQALQNKYDELKNITNNYTDDSWKNFNNKLNNAKELFESDYCSQNSLDKALESLISAYNGLIENTVINELLYEIDYASKMDVSIYTKTSYAKFKEDLDNAIIVSNNTEATNQDIIDATNNLKASKSYLVLVGNKTELNSKLLTLTYQIDDYTISTFNNYLEKREYAKAIYNKEDPSQQEIDGALNNLNEAIRNLQRRGNVNELSSLVESMKDVKQPEDDTNGYFAKFNEALSYAKSIIKSNDVNQEQVDEAKKLLNDTYSLINGNNEKENKGCNGSISISLFGSLLVFGLAIYLIKVKNKLIIKKGKTQ